MRKIFLPFLFAAFVILLVNSAIFASVEEPGISFENQNYIANLADGNVDASFTVVNNMQTPVVFGYFTFYSTSQPEDVEIYINGVLADKKYVHLSSYEKYTTITYDHLWEPLPAGQSINISLKYTTKISEEGLLFKEIEIIPGKLSFKDFSSVHVKAAVLTIKTPNPITYSNYPEFQISSDENSVIWQDDGSQRRYIVEYSAIPFFKNNTIPGYFIFWIFLFFVVVGGYYMYEKRAPKDFVDVKDIISDKKDKTTKRKQHKN